MDALKIFAEFIGIGMLLGVVVVVVSCVVCDESLAPSPYGWHAADYGHSLKRQRQRA